MSPNPRKSRYAKRKKKVMWNGRKFDSKAEANRAAELELLQRSGKISCLSYQVRILIEIGEVEVRYPSGRQMAYVADFTYYDEKDRLVVEDVKMKSGFLPETYKLKRALLLAMGIKILETR